MQDQQQARADASPRARVVQRDASAGTDKSALRGKPFAEQEAMLAPGGTLDGSGGGSGGGDTPGKELDGSRWEAIVRQQFSAWDTDGNGVIDAKEVSAHLHGGKFHGPELAALATLTIYAERLRTLDTPTDKKKGGPKGVSLADLDVFAKSYPKFPEGDVLNMIEADNSHYARKLEAADAGLFGADGQPDWNAVEQSARGSCTFLSAVISMAQNDPQGVAKRVQLTGTSQSGGMKSWTFAVTLGTKTKVVTLTELQLLDAATAGDDGLWLAALEEALGQELGHKKAYVRGAHPSEGIEHLTGQEATSFDLPNAKLEDVRAALTQAFARKAIVTAGLFAGDVADGITSGHAYAVVGFAGDKVTVRDPYRGIPQGGGDPKFDKRTPDDSPDGLLELDLATFMKSFSALSIGA